MYKGDHVAVFWFRRDLRLEDNAGLYHALNSGYRVLPVFIFDRNILDKLESSYDRRVSFIHGALEHLQKQMTEAGSALLVLHDSPENAVRKILSDYNVQAFFANHDYEPYATDRDRRITGILKESSIPFHTFKDQVIYEKDEVLKSDGTPYTVFTPYSRVWKKNLKEEHIRPYPSETLTGNFLKLLPLRLPSLADISFLHVDGTFGADEVAGPFGAHGTDAGPLGADETDAGLFRTPEIDTAIIGDYHKTRNIPSLRGTTRLGVHIRFGTVSIRELVRTALSLNEVWLNELIWREFFMSILWHYPHVVDNSFRKKYDNITWRNNEEEFERWCNGMTGYPIVDAGMREINATGYMHNRVRMITAGFLTKHLLIDWRWGEAYFGARLLDYELSSNNGNWQWAAGSGCDAAPYFRVFNPAEQTRKFDPDLTYIKKWVPELDTPSYPRMIVDHPFARERAMKIYSEGLRTH
ncbi:MAG: deoxyribodipyrimidine photo-lyase [Bacteroidales bacterium]|nr:deoxyribodipyrimidine photo-lyase [Bacteroidales bacterium]